MGIADPIKDAASDMASNMGNLRKGAEALTVFKKRVDAALSELEQSAANQGTMSEQQLTRGVFSAGNTAFAEADGVFKQYNRVHRELTELSQSLSEQIEAMGIAVRGADIGFDNLEEDVRRRFWQIQQRADGAGERDPSRGGADNDSKQLGF